MGEVYRARDTKLGREVAIKVVPEAFALDADRVARFEREAKVLASLNHPHIAALYGMEMVDGRHLLIMELVEGATLAERIAQVTSHKAQIAKHKSQGPRPSRRPGIEDCHSNRRGAGGGSREGRRAPRPETGQREDHAGR